MQGLVRHGLIALIALGLAARGASAQGKPDQPVDLNGSGGDAQPVTGQDEHPLAISGFGVGGYTYDGRTGDNSAAAGKIAVSLFRELTDNLYVFGQLTTSLSDEGDAEPATETEIDNLLVSFTPPGASNLSLTFGTLDAPVGFERDDEVLLFTPSTSFNFELARPAKLTGLFGGWSLSPRVDLTAMVANGWDSPLDPNHGKTGGLRLGVLPAEGASLGVSALYGSEGPADSTTNRLLLDVDYALEPGPGGSWRARRTTRRTTTCPAAATPGGRGRRCWCTARWPATGESRRARRCWTTRTAPAPARRRRSPRGPSRRSIRWAWGARGSSRTSSTRTTGSRDSSSGAKSG